MGHCCYTACNSGQYPTGHAVRTSRRRYKEEPKVMNESTQRNGQPEKMAKWKTALIVIAVIAFFLWMASGESGDGSDCTRLGNGAEWGADC